MEPLLHVVYKLVQWGHSDWIARQSAPEFDSISRFCQFIGYPRSGHSIVGAMLNAHPNVVISHELNIPGYIHQGCTRNQLYSRIIARSVWWNMRGNTSNYVYQIPNQWQGSYSRLKVIGDKQGGSVSMHLAAHPGYLQQIRMLVDIPVRFIHVVRNPFDNISAISLWHKMTLEKSIEYYFYLCHITGQLHQIFEQQEILTVHHEDMIQEPAPFLSRLCRFIDVDPCPDYLKACCDIVFPSLTCTRHKVNWPAECIRKVEKRMRPYPFFDRYGFDGRTIT